MSHALPENWKDLTEDELISRLSDTETLDPLVAQLLSDSESWDVKDLVEEIAYRQLPDEWKALPDNEYIGDKLRENDITDTEVLDILAKSSDFYVREAVASNAATPQLTLEILGQSHDEDIASVAKQTLGKLKILMSESLGLTRQSLELKSEPGGAIWFGRLEDSLVSLVEQSAKEKALSSVLEWLWNSGEIEHVSGVFNHGCTGEDGLLGKIAIASHVGIQDSSSELEDGHYYLYSTLSKVSTGLDLVLEENEPFQPAMLEEVSIRVLLPAIFFLMHQTYADDLTNGSFSEFNVVTGFRYKGNPVDSYNGKLYDRGYDAHLVIVRIENGSAHMIFSSDGETEEWG